MPDDTAYGRAGCRSQHTTAQHRACGTAYDGTTDGTLICLVILEQPASVIKSAAETTLAEYFRIVFLLMPLFQTLG
jgi:hypothetical protein